MAQKIYHLVAHKILNITVYFVQSYYLYFSQKQLLREMESRLLIIAGYIFWQLFLWRLYIYLEILKKIYKKIEYHQMN